MNRRQFNRLLNVAGALRDREDTERFSMHCYVHGDIHDSSFGPKHNKDWCGTPACALGTFAARPDLQRLLKITWKQQFASEDSTGKVVLKPVPIMVFQKSGNKASYDHAAIMAYFGLTFEQSADIFGHKGCNDAKTPIQAAQYIEKFLLNNYSE